MKGSAHEPWSLTLRPCVYIDCMCYMQRIIIAHLASMRFESEPGMTYVVAYKMATANMSCIDVIIVFQSVLDWKHNLNDLSLRSHFWFSMFCLLLREFDFFENMRYIKMEM